MFIHTWHYMNYSYIGVDSYWHVFLRLFLTTLLLFYHSSSSFCIYLLAPSLCSPFILLSPTRPFLPWYWHFHFLPTLLLWEWSVFTLLVFAVTPGYRLSCEDLEIGVSNVREHVTFIFLCLDYLTQYHLF